MEDLIIHNALGREDHEWLRSYILEHPEIVVPYQEDGKTAWIVDFASMKNYDLLKAALEVGFPVNTLRLPERWHALSTAITRGRLDLIELLLQHGADCNLDRCIVTLVGEDDPAFVLAALKLLLAHGLELNRVFDMFQEPGTEYTALDRITPGEPVYTFLRSHGAMHYDELKAKK